MKMKLTLGILGVCLIGQGCGPITLATRTLVIEPIHYCLIGDNLAETHRNYKLADEVWEAIAQAEPDHPYSPDYAHGFKDGFADYLYAGGTGEPPPLPPRYYWKIDYETPEGHQAIQDWFAGFRRGAEVAQQSGYRQLVILPSSLPPQNPPDRQALPTASESKAVPSSELLPLPRPIAPDGGHTTDAVGPPAPGKDSLGKSKADTPDRVVLPPD